MATKTAHKEMKGPIGRVSEAKKTAAKVPKEPPAFKASAAAGGHTASPPGIASAHKRGPMMTQGEQSAEHEKVAHEHGAEGSNAESNGMPRKLAKPRSDQRSYSAFVQKKH